MILQGWIAIWWSVPQRHPNLGRSRLTLHWAAYRLLVL
ncbi:hypothetical protein Hhel01_01446 [Haloferula helveola]